MAYKFAFVMDPLESVLPDKDTTFVFMLEAIARGHQVFFLGLKDLYSRGHQGLARARRCEVMRAVPHFRYLDDGAQYPLEHFDAIFMRKDPPADANYLYATMLLSLADPHRTFVLNSPSGLREANEKLYALNFPGAIPPTLVTYEIPRLKQFMEEQGGEMIVKPLDGHGGEGVFHAQARDRNLNAILETVTRFETRPVMGQRYIPEVRNGDKRMIVVDGEPLGGTLRVPREDEHRGNIHVGGFCVKAEITARDREICRMLRPRLQRVDRLDGVNLEAKVIDFVESRVAALKT